MHRAKFYPPNDMANGFQLARAEEVLNSYSPESDPSLEEAMEYFNIIRIFESGRRLERWTDAEYDCLKKEAQKLHGIVKKSLNSLDSTLPRENPASIPAQFKTLSFDYTDDFWAALEKYGLLDKLNIDVIEAILNDDAYRLLSEVLSNKKLVQKYDTELAEYMRTHYACAQIIVEKYQGPKDRNHSEIFIPASLSIADRENIFANYCQSENPSLSTLVYIQLAKDIPGSMTVSPKTRVVAKKHAEEMRNKLQESYKNNSLHFTYRIGFDAMDNDLPVQASLSDLDLTVTLNSRVLDSMPLEEMASLAYELEWMNPMHQIALVANLRHNSIMDIISGDAGQFHYPLNHTFHWQNQSALLTLMALDKYLRDCRGSSIETLLERYYSEIIIKELRFPGLPVSFPKPDDTYANKIKALAPEMESLVKQYNLFVTEGNIDPDLYRMSYGIHITEAKSLLDKKYCYISDTANDLNRAMFLLFSSQSPLTAYHGDKAESSEGYASSFIELIANNEAVLDRQGFYEHQLAHIDFLANQGYLHISPDGKIQVDDFWKVSVLKLFFEHQEISYWTLSPKQRAVIDKFAEEGLVEFDNFLLSRKERDYYDYYLNDHKFTNGLKIRNLYEHGIGASTVPEDEQRNHCYILLLLTLLLMLKISSDLLLASSFPVITHKSTD